MKPRELAALSNAHVYPDESMSFALQRADGQEFEISCSQDQLTDVYQFLASLAQEANELAATEATQERPQISPIQTDGVGFGVSDDASQTPDFSHRRFSLGLLHAQ
jgi:hypothetical protein